MDLTEEDKIDEVYDRRVKIFKDEIKKVQKDADAELWGKVVIGLNNLKERLALLM